MSRREVFDYAKAIPLTVPVAMIAVTSPANATGKDELHDLWNERRRLRPLAIQAEQEQVAAERSMPWWAQPGPSELNNDGTISGPISIWPAIQDATPSQHIGAVRKIRLSPDDLKRWYTGGLFFGSHAKKPHRKALRALAEQIKVRLAEFEARAAALQDQTYHLSRAIIEHPDYSADAVAARLLVGLLWSATTRDSTGTNIYGIEDALNLLRPHLTGNIAADVSDLLDNQDTPIMDRMAWV